MNTRSDIRREAQAVVKCQGDNAAVKGRNTDERLVQGDLEGRAVWKWIMRMTERS